MEILTRVECRTCRGSGKIYQKASGSIIETQKCTASGCKKGYIKTWKYVSEEVLDEVLKRNRY